MGTEMAPLLDKKMKINIKWSIVGIAVFVLCGVQVAPDGMAAADGMAPTIALMPFFTGQLESPNEPLPAPLSKPIGRITQADPDLPPEDPDRILYRIVEEALRKRVAERMLPRDLVADAYAAVENNPTLDTPRKRAVELGQMVGADIVMVGTVWRFREKGALADVPGSPASVGFAFYLVDVASGIRLWRDAFEGTQTALTQDVLGGIKQLGMGLHWLSARELARYGVKSVFRKLPADLLDKPRPGRS